MPSIARLRMDSCTLLLLAGIVCGVPSAQGQYFFPGGADVVHYDPSGGVNGRIYVGDFRNTSLCHYRIDLPPGKTVTDVWFRHEHGQVAYTDGSGRLVVLESEDFESVTASGDLCPENPKKLHARAPAAGPTSIAVSNGAIRSA